MSQLHKILLMIPLFIATNVGLVKSAHAFDIGVGARLGYEASLNLHWPGDDLFFGDNAYAIMWDSIPISNNFTAGIFADLRLIEWFSLTPTFNFSVNRRTKMGLYVYDTLVEDVSINVSTTTFDLELLAKFHVGWWYFGTGVGLSLNNAPSFTAVSQGAKENFEELYTAVEKRGFTGFNIVFDTGFYFPIGTKRHNVFLGWRSTITVNAISSLLTMIDANENEDSFGFSKEAFGITPISTSITLGYVYRFI